MNTAVTFETFTVLRKDLANWPTSLNRIAKMIEESKIKVVDIRKQRDKLTIIYRHID